MRIPPAGKLTIAAGRTARAVGVMDLDLVVDLRDAGNFSDRGQQHLKQVPRWQTALQADHAVGYRRPDPLLPPAEMGMFCQSPADQPLEIAVLAGGPVCGGTWSGRVRAESESAGDGGGCGHGIHSCQVRPAWPRDPADLCRLAENGGQGIARFRETGPPAACSSGKNRAGGIVRTGKMPQD